MRCLIGSVRSRIEWCHPKSARRLIRSSPHQSASTAARETTASETCAARLIDRPGMCATPRATWSVKIGSKSGVTPTTSVHIAALTSASSESCRIAARLSRCVTNAAMRLKAPK
eukprot:3857634-Prymnesium_polylepis.1